MAHRFLASRGTPSSALQSGSLLVFPSPWSGDHGAVVSTSFPSLDSGRGPATPAGSAMNPATPSCGEIDAV